MLDPVADTTARPKRQKGAECCKRVWLTKSDELRRLVSGGMRIEEL